MILSSFTLGQALRWIIKRDFKTIKDACRDLNFDDRELRRCWTTEAKRVKIETVMRRLDQLGYEVHFTLVRKNESNQRATAQHGRGGVRIKPDQC